MERSQKRKKTRLKTATFESGKWRVPSPTSKCRTSPLSESNAMLSNGSPPTNPAVVEGRSEAEDAALRDEVDSVGPEHGVTSVNPTVVAGGTCAVGAPARYTR